MDMYGLSSSGSFHLDDLLDFSDHDLPSSSSTSSSSFPPENTFNHHCPSASSFHPSPFPTDFTHDLCFPSDDVAHLEWLSQFVDDSFSDFPANLLGGGNMPVRSDLSFPGKARSEPSRGPTAATATRAWKSVSESESTATGKARPKKENGRHSAAAEAEAEAGVRRCTHCASENTPQWRTGPLGPKTLCNACGVRYKSGRLVPEYRPAASPTFVPTEHSNSHRKVVELRRQKEVMKQ